MVQRKVPSKLGIQADHVKYDKRLGSPKPSSCQHQDSKNTGSDMKKKMKRSRSNKLSDIQSLNSSPLRKTMCEPGKLPPMDAATPQKQPMIKTTGGSPNYMKATSSSEARKERSQVSSLNTSTSSDRKSLSRRKSGNSKLSSASSNKPTKSLTRSSSSKRMRTLTKTPSFKPARTAAKKCSRVALCADTDVQKATCSSTLKDSKFPPYLMLNPGATEAEGTSVLKVCPYTYCSLNGHHHTTLPPLKCFLKAKRRSMKAQKSAKLEVPSPCRAKQSSLREEEISSELLTFSGDKSPQHEADSIDSNVPIVKSVGVDFFIEIYAKSTGDCTEATEKHSEDDEGTLGFAGEHEERNDQSSFHGGNKAASPEDDRQQGAENLVGASPYLEIDYASMEEDNITENSDMEWEEGQSFTSEIHTEADNLNKPKKEYCINVGYLSEIKQLDLPDEPKITMSDDMISSCTEEILADEVLQELFEEETTSFDTQSRNSDSEVEGMLQELFEEETIQADGDSIYDLPSFIKDAFEEPTIVEDKSEEAEKDLMGTANASPSMGMAIVESLATNGNIQDNGICETKHDIFEMIFPAEDAANYCSTSAASADWNGHEEGKSLQEDKIQTNGGQKLKETEVDENLATSVSSPEELPSSEAGKPTKEAEQAANVESSTVIEISVSAQDSKEANQDCVEAHDKQHHIIAEACQFDEIVEANSSNQDLVTESKSTEYCDHTLDGQADSIKAVKNKKLIEEDPDRAKKFKVPTFMDPEEQNNLRISKINSAGKDGGEVENMEVEVCIELDTASTFPAANNGTNAQPGTRYLRKASNSSQEPASICSRKWTIQCKKPIIDSEEERSFNPREPNFLPLVPEPGAEKVDLKHQIMDDRKNSEEWMLDYALQQAVTKLAPARKRKVALLVEAFEAVLPVPKYETHSRNTSEAFPHIRPMQTCS